MISHVTVSVKLHAAFTRVVVGQRRLFLVLLEGQILQPLCLCGHLFNDTQESNPNSCYSQCKQWSCRKYKVIAVTDENAVKAGLNYHCHESFIVKTSCYGCFLEKT